MTRTTAAAAAVAKTMKTTKTKILFGASTFGGKSTSTIDTCT
jgi:hypothetical protein